jgi:DNA-binding NtrC family response regulator
MNRHVLPPLRDECARLKRYSWPGNIRELQNVIERSVTLCPDDTPLIFVGLENEGESLRFDHLHQILQLADYHQQMAAFQRVVIQRALKSAAGNKTHAAQKLGIHATHLYKILKQMEMH